MSTQDGFPPLPRRMPLALIEAEAEAFFEWPTADRAQVLLTSAVLFARYLLEKFAARDVQWLAMLRAAPQDGSKAPGAKCHWPDCPHGADCVHAAAPTRKAQEAAGQGEFEVWTGWGTDSPELCASTGGSTLDALREASRYAAQYAADGAVTITEATRTVVAAEDPRWQQLAAQQAAEGQQP